MAKGGKRMHEGGGWLEGLALFLTFARVVRGEDPTRVREQTAELVAKGERLMRELNGYMSGEPSKREGSDG